MKPRQTTSGELTGKLLDFLQRKFYEGQAVEFNKDKRRLLKWVVLWPASWLHDKGVAVPEERYSQIFMDVMMLALQQGDTGAIKYRPAWLAKVIQSHFQIHGDEIYAAAKSMRSLADHSLAMTGKLPVAGAPDVTREMALANQLLSGSGRKKKTVVKRSFNEPLNLEFKL